MTKRPNLFRRVWTALFHPPSISADRATTGRKQQGAASKSPVLILVEGSNDPEFLRRASAILRVADVALPDLGDLERRGEVVFVPLGGGDLRSWTYRLASMGLPEIHILDREASPVTELRHEAARIVNLRPGCRAFVTAKRALENYLDPRAIFAVRGIEVEFAADEDVPDLVAEQLFLRRHPGDSWAEQPARCRRRQRYKVKSWLNRQAVDRMTAEQFVERDPAGEIPTAGCRRSPGAGGLSVIVCQAGRLDSHAQPPRLLTEQIIDALRQRLMLFSCFRCAKMKSHLHGFPMGAANIAYVERVLIVADKSERSRGFAGTERLCALVQNQSAARRMWERLLSPEERRQLGDDIRQADWTGGPVGMQMRLRGVSQTRAIVELARGLGFINEATETWLLREFGEPSVPPAGAPPTIPVWNRDTFELRLGDEVIRRVLRPHAATNVIRVLNVFQEMNWPARIDDPLPGGRNQQRAASTPSSH